MTSAISLRGVTKEFVKYDDAPMLASVTRLWSKSRRSLFTALRDVDLEVSAGESLGVIGRNGAGKSTLLSLLCGVSAPTAGVVEVRGRVAPLLSVGVGFHPEMTGRENVFVNGTILGLSRQEIERRFDDIVDFAEIDDFVDTPVKFYSSGMFVRLGFAVAVEARPDVLLVDEVLAVGDLPFQMKCFDRMQEIRGSGTTVVVVTHNMNNVRGFCDRAVVLQHGSLVYDGLVPDAIARYHSLIGSGEDREVEAADSELLEVTGFDLVSADGVTTHAVHSGEVTRLRVSVRARLAVSRPLLWVGITSALGVWAYSDTNLVAPFPDLVAGEEATYDIELSMALAAGSYTAEASVHRAGDATGDTVALANASALHFYVIGRGHVHGVADLGARFSVESQR